MKNRMLGLVSSRYLKEKYILVESMDYCVYFITDGEFIKIGAAASLPNRIKQLQTGNPRRLKALFAINAGDQKDAIKIESELHNCFESERIIGEWFCVKEDDIKNSCHKLGYEYFRPASRFNFEIDGIRIINQK